MKHEEHNLQKQIDALKKKMRMMGEMMMSDDEMESEHKESKGRMPKKGMEEE